MRRLIKQEFMKAFMRCGVPPSVLLAPYPDNLDKMMANIEIPRPSGMQAGGISIHDKVKQRKTIDGFKEVILKNDLRSKGKLMLFSARDTDHLPNQLALEIALFTAEKSHQFHWHSLYGGTRDDLRDDPAASKEIMDKCSLLILSNLADNSTAMKVEKARDLLTRHSGLNRIVITAGMNPVEYAQTVLRMKCDAYVYF